eukprot:3053971-Rhodomonas_salina.1
MGGIAHSGFKLGYSLCPPSCSQRWGFSKGGREHSQGGQQLSLLPGCGWGFGGRGAHTGCISKRGLKGWGKGGWSECCLAASIRVPGAG